MWAKGFHLFKRRKVQGKKKTMWFIGVEVEQETSTPPKKILDPPLHVFTHALLEIRDLGLDEGDENNLSRYWVVHAFSSRKRDSRRYSVTVCNENVLVT